MTDNTKNLRPYYDQETFNSGYPAVYRPGIGVVDEHGNTIASKISRSSSSGLKRILGINNNHGVNYKDSNKTLRSIAKVTDYNENITRNMYADLEFSEYFDWNNVGELVKSLINSFVKNYLRSLVAQPFEVARLLLQVGDFETVKGKNDEEKEGDSHKKAYNKEDEDYDDEDDDDEIDYFQPKSSSPEEDSIHTRTRTIKRQPASITTTPSKRRTEHKQLKHSKHNYLKPVSLNTVDIITSVLSLEGIRGLWRASNATFIQNVLFKTFEAWITGFFSPFLQIPDPFFIDVTHSPEPVLTLVLSLSASIIAGLLLAPLDLIRTKLIVTSIDGNERSIRNSIKNLSFFTCPVSLIIPTVLNTLGNTFFKKFTPFILYSKFSIDSYTSPLTYSVLGLFSSILELLIKLPTETLLRRAQVSYLLKNSKSSSNSLKISDEDKLIVEFAGFSGIWRTFYDIYYFKGENSGVEGLFRGWRVGVLSIIGSYGLNILQVNYDDQSYMEEKF